MLFEELFKSALGQDTEPFQDLIYKAMDMGSIPPSGLKKKKTMNTAAESAPAHTAPKVAKIKTGGGSPVKAKKKTGIQIDSSTAPVKQTIVTPDGPQHKTFHEGVGGGPTSTKTSLIIPAKKVPSTKKKPDNQPDVTYKPHPSGENVATGHSPNQVPVDFKLDAKGQWYHDHLKPGDKVGFNGWSDEFKHWVPVESEVSTLNPNGSKIVHVKPLHKDLANDPEADPLQVHYNKLSFYRRKSEGDPGKWDHFEYPGEYTKPQITDPPAATPQPEMSPEDHHAHSVHQQELVKQKTESIKKHLKGGDVVEFWMRDPASNKLVLNRGTVHNMAAQGSGGKGGKSKAGKDGETPDINNAIVQTKEGYEDVPLDQIKRFGQYGVDELHLYSFDPNNAKWQRDSKSAQEVQPATDKAPEATGVSPNMMHPATMPHGPSEPQPANPNAEQKPAQGESEQQAGKPNFADEPQDASQVIMSAGGKYIDEDPEENLVFFQDPESGKVHAMPKDDINTQNVLSKMGKTPQSDSKDSFHTPDEVEQHKRQDITQHWTHQMPEDLVGHVRGLVDKLDNYSNNGEPLPTPILMARHSLLHDYDSKKAMKNAARIEEFLHNPGAIPKVKPPLQRQDYQKKFNGVQNFNSVSFEDAKSKLGTTKLAHPILENKQQKALSQLDGLAQKNGLPGFSGAVHQIDPKIDNRNLINFYKVKLEDALKSKGETHEPVHLDLPTDENLDSAHHVNEMAQHLKDNKLLIPAYRKKMEQLNYFLENSPDSPAVEKLMNEVHKYGYVHGPNDPRFQSHIMRHQLEQLPKGKYDPRAVKQIDHLLNRVDEGGAAVPKDHIELAHKIAKTNGIPLEETPEIPFNASAQAKSKLDSMIEHRKFVEQQKVADEQAQKTKASESPIEPPKAATPMDAQAQDVHTQNKVKEASRTVAQLKSNEASYNKIINDLNEQGVKPDPATVQVLHNMYSSMQRSSQSLAKIKNELAPTGTEVEDYTPNVKPFGGAKDKTDNNPTAVDMVHNNLSRMFNNADEKKKVWLENQVGFTHNDVQVARNHFLSGVHQQMPNVQQDLQSIDQAVGDMLNQQKWQPMDVGLAKTPQGKQFLQMVNDKIERLKKREQLAGVTIDEALGKSLDEIISAEKILARRDISLALRKSFSDDKQSDGVQHATQLLGAYVDDFVQTIMTTYTNIPLTVRKSISRKLLKSLILNVIKENEFAAMGMTANYTTPLNENVVKSLGQRIASIVTEFRIEANPSKQMLVIDIAKSIETTSPSGEYFTHGHSLVKSDAPITQELWQTLMVDLEHDMYKAGLLETSISPFRIKKFVTDNDQKTLINFYNENVKTLDARLEELSNGRR